MTVTTQQLLDLFGSAALAGNASVFVGAGLSKAASADFPDWPELVEPLRLRAGIPGSVTDLPLVAEYFEHAAGRTALDAHIAHAIGAVRAGRSPGHDLLAELPVEEVWTTNYDRLLEAAMPEATTITGEEGLANRRQPGHKRIIKMHGSLGADTAWESPPVVTRGDYEQYEESHPRMWAALTATFLTRSLLFLGFGFADPNVELFLRLARRVGWGAPEHFAVLRKPADPEERRAHGHRVADLERSGVGVVEIDEFDELPGLLAVLVRRCRPAQLYVAGSGDGVAAIGRRLGRALAHLDGLGVASLAGDAGRAVSYGFAEARRELGAYDPDQVRFLFRRKDDAGAPPPAPDERTGVAVYTDAAVEELRRDAIDAGRAMLVVGGGARTLVEAEIAAGLGVPVVPLAYSGGAAREIWERQRDRLGELRVGGAPVDPVRFDALASPDARRHVPHTIAVVRQAMYL